MGVVGVLVVNETSKQISPFFQICQKNLIKKAHSVFIPLYSDLFQP